MELSVFTSRKKMELLDGEGECYRISEKVNAIISLLMWEVAIM
jgi:hypothetical protein